MASKLKDSNGLINYKFLYTFGREYFKHKVLWKPNYITAEFELQTATHRAYRKLAQTLNLPVEAIFEILEYFPAACLDLRSRYEMDAGCRAPDWLMPVARHFSLLNISTKCYSTRTSESEAVSHHDLVRALLESVRAGAPSEQTKSSGGNTGKGTRDHTSPLQGPRAVAHFVARHNVTEDQVLQVWRSVVKLCVVKLRVLGCAGDCAPLVPAGLRPAPAETALADVALLHNCLLSQIKYMTPAKHRTLVLLFQLVVAAKEAYDGEERPRRHHGPGPSHPAREEGATTGPRGDALETENADSSTGPTSAPNGQSSTIVESLKYVEPSSGHDLLREKEVMWGRRPGRHGREDLTDTKAEESEDNGLHTELDLNPNVHVVSSDTCDNEISNNNIDAPNVLIPNRVEDSGSKRIDTFDFTSPEERKSDIPSKSQNSDTGSDHPTRFWYEESKCNSSEEQRVVWAMVYTEFIKRGRSASLVSLQHRWLELLHRARLALLKAWSSDVLADKDVHPLLLLVAHRFPGIVTESLPLWKTLVLERQVVLETDVKDIINKYLEKSKILLNVNENLTYPDLLKEYVIDNNVHDPPCPSKSNDTCTLHNENTSSIIDNIDKVVDQDSPDQCSSKNNESNVNSCISTVLDQIDPSKATVTIIVDEDSDEDDNRRNVRGGTSDITDLLASSDTRRPPSRRELDSQIPNSLPRGTQIKEIAINNKLNYINNPVDPSSDLSVNNSSTELNENIEGSNELLEDEQTPSVDHRDELSAVRPSRPVIDEKLVKMSLVVVTPIEHLPEWKKHSRHGVVKCRKFSVKNFTKLVPIESISKNRLSKYTPCIDTNKNDSEEHENENHMKNEVRIKFEDDDFGLDADINNGIVYQKYIELYGMSDHTRKNRIKLTRTLKLSRTYFSLNFWSLDRNIELLKLCKPMTIKLNKGLPRVAKRVELSDINEVRRMNRSILTAQVSPVPVDVTPSPTQRSSVSHGAVSTTRRTNNSVSSALDSSELLELLTNYAIRTKITESASEPVTRAVTGFSNLMDSIIDTMRLGDANNKENSNITLTFNSLQQSSETPSSGSSQVLIETSNIDIDKHISATDTCNTTQKSTDEVSNNDKSNSMDSTLTDAAMRQIHISSNYTKKLYIKHVQKMNKTNSTCNMEQTDLPSACDLKHLILHLVNQFYTNTRHNYNMKLNRSGLKKHLSYFETQQRALVKDISKLTKLLPQYDFNMKPRRSYTKNTTKEKKQKKTNQIKCKQSKEQPTLPDSTESTDHTNDIHNNTRSVFDDDDDHEPNLVIDESSLELRENTDLINSQINKRNNNKSIQETRKKRQQDKKEKKVKRSRKKSKQSKKIPEEDKPLLNEYQEWQRQKTMALKYFTLPMSDTSKLTPKDKVAKTTDRQSFGCQTNLSMKRKNTEELASTSTASEITKRSKLQPNDSDVVCISDDSSDEEVQVTGYYSAKETAQAPAPANINKNNTNTDIQHIQETENRIQFVVFASPTQKVIGTPVAAMTQPIYYIGNLTPGDINTTQPTDTINKPILYQVLTNATPFLTTPTRTQNNNERAPGVSVTEASDTLRCQRETNEQCKCIKCQNTLGSDDILTYSLNSRNNETSTFVEEQISGDRVFEDAITVKEYLSSNKLTALIKVSGSKNLVFFCRKYIILTDVNIPSSDATYRTTFEVNQYKFLSKVLVPSETKGNVLLLGPKKETDYIYCKCVKETRAVCSLCHRIETRLPSSRNFVKIDSDYFKKICSAPIKYVRLNKNELAANSRVVLEGNPDLMLVNQMFFKKLTDSPPTYVRILSAVPDATVLRHLVRRQVGLYTFDVTQRHLVHAPLLYAQSEGRVTVDHSDDNLVKVMQLMLN